MLAVYRDTRQIDQSAFSESVITLNLPVTPFFVSTYYTLHNSDI